MAELTTKGRKAIPSSSFGMPESRKYPIPDKSHARNALARVSQMQKKGKISSSDAAKVRAKARAKLGKKGKGE